MVFKKGQSGNPKGRKKCPPEIKYMKKLSKEFVQCRITHWLQKPLSEVMELLKDPKQQAMDHFICKIIVLGVMKGDHQRLSFLLDRLIGKVKEHVEFVEPAPFIIQGKTQTLELGSKMEEKDGDQKHR
jgi:hypothetical protein